MALEVSEVTLKAFVESVWFKGLARGAMIGGAVIGGYVGYILTSVKTDVAQLQTNVDTVKDALDIRVRDQESFQSEVDRDLGTINKKVDTLDLNVDTMQTDVATVKGILIQMQRETDVASNRRLTRDLME
jgi:hypothetical protein